MKKSKEMIMTEELASQLLNTLACVAFSATGGAIQDAEGNFNQEQIKFVQEYARQTFRNILGDWENKTGKKWNIVTKERMENNEDED